MKKIILRIDEKLSDEEALKKSLSVVQMGKISESEGQKQYCFYTVFNNGTRVSVMKRPSGTETFYIR